jgi:hypothetical protein
MMIENSPLYKVADDIMNQPGTAHVSQHIRLILPNKETYDPISLIAVNITRDYVGAFGDVLTCSATVGLGDYSRIIYPNRVGLEAVISEQLLIQGHPTVDSSIPRKSKKYYALLLDQGGSPTVGQGAEKKDQETLNLQQLVTIHFQLIEKVLEPFTASLVGGTYRDTTVAEVLLTAATNAMAALKLEQEDKLIGMDIFQADSTVFFKQILIPHDTSVEKLPALLQRKFGLFNAGIGHYVQNGHWYVYPLHNTSCYGKSHRSLSIFVLPKRKYRGATQTYDDQNGVVRVLATGEVSFADDSGSNYLEEGNGVRYVDTQSLISDGIRVENNQVKVSRSTNNREIISDKPTHGVNNSKMADEKIVTNAFVQYSKLAARKGGILVCQWQNSDVSLLHPGMPVKVTYADEQGTKLVYGVLHACQQSSSRVGDVKNSVFMNNAKLTVFVNDQVELIE